jgi:hypothetical protein
VSSRLSNGAQRLPEVVSGSMDKSGQTLEMT